MVSIIHTDAAGQEALRLGLLHGAADARAGRRIPYVRGKVLGGSSSINGMVYVRGNQQNYDDWAAEGCTGWGYADALRCFKRLEDWEGGANEHRGAGGPIAVTPDEGPDAGVDGASSRRIAETCGVPVLDDYNGASQEGVDVCQMNARDGRRFSSSEAYVHPARRARTSTC